MTVAVIGAGPIGLAALKNLREEGADVTCFEKASTVGGVWNFNPDPTITSVLKTTVSNVSRFTFCYTDFPAPDHYPAFMTAPQVSEYVEAYATNFKLHEHIVFNTKVQKVVRNNDNTRWQLHLVKGDMSEVIEFDKVVLCTGCFENPFLPKFEGSDGFKGKMIHSQAFKRPEEFEGMKVLIVGLGNTAADTSTSLIGHASKIYVAHRQGAQVLPRHCLGKPVDLNLRQRDERIKNMLTDYVPGIAAKIHDHFMIGLSKKEFGPLPPEWKIHPPPSIKSHQPIISDTLISSLRDGSIISVAGLRAFTGANEAELLDGTRLQVDAVIFCTGYEVNFSVMPDHDPTLNTNSTEKPDHTTKINAGSLARLYQNILDPRYPDSVAWLCHWGFTVGAISIGDLLAMALAQIWHPVHPYPLPSRSVMESAIDAHHNWIHSLAKKDGVYSTIVQEGPWQAWLHEVAGTGINENLGYGLQGWWFWMGQPGWCGTLMGGVDSPSVWRLFDAPGGTGTGGKGKGRKKWEGARAAVERANVESRRFCD